MVKEPKPVTNVPVELKEDTKSAHRILDSYHLSEKSNLLSSSGRYVFKVSINANKIEVRKAVEAVYGVHVVSVNMVVVAGKQRRTGRVSGRTQDWKKAVVTLKAGEKITGLAEGV
ncbi:MAG: 50S ribosomal protein L23 [Candidatus Doudnabacteria bacterium]|nr:50S ribosomal protein L23 [Candidatus Doudnabacteria bacterium]